MTLFKLEEYLIALKVEEELLYSEGDWDQLGIIRMAIDEVLTQIENFKKGA